MLKDSDIPRYAVRRTKRIYSADTKAELIAACLVSGASIAAIANAHDMNANVLHRWLKDQRRPALSGNACAEVATLEAPALEFPSFIPVPLAVKPAEPEQQMIQVEIRKGALKMTVTWPISSTSDFARWSTAILK
jgi:transposase